MKQVINFNSPEFFTQMKQAATASLTKGHFGVRNGSHSGSPYINRQGRLFGITDEFDTHYDIEHGVLDDVHFLKIRQSEPVGKDKKDKPVYSKTSFKTSVKSTGTPFFTVSRLCKELFGDKKDWKPCTLNFVGEQDDWSFYVIEVEEDTVESTSDNTSDTSEPKDNTK